MIANPDNSFDPNRSLMVNLENYQSETPDAHCNVFEELTYAKSQAHQANDFGHKTIKSSKKAQKQIPNSFMTYAEKLKQRKVQLSVRKGEPASKSFDQIITEGSHGVMRFNIETQETVRRKDRRMDIRRIWLSSESGLFIISYYNLLK